MKKHKHETVNVMPINRCGAQEQKGSGKKPPCDVCLSQGMPCSAMTLWLLDREGFEDGDSFECDLIRHSF